jgi:hypothetical protein
MQIYKRRVKEYCDEFYAKKIQQFAQTGEFSKIHELPKVTQDEIKWLKKPLSIKEIYLFIYFWLAE